MSARIPGLVLAAAVSAGLSMPDVRAPAAAQEFPSRPIEFIVPWGPGGGADQVARKLAKLMEPKLKVSMPVVNVPGATGQTGLTKMLTAPADGYSISVFIGDTFALQAGTPLPKWTMERDRCRWASSSSSRRRSWCGGRQVQGLGRRREGRQDGDAARRRDWLRLQRRSHRQLPRQEGPEVRERALPQAGRALLGDPRRPRRGALRADRRRAQLRRQQADEAGDRVRREARRELPGRADLRRARPQGHAAAVPRHRRQGRHRPQGRQDARRRARRRRQGPRVRRLPARTSTPPPTASWPPPRPRPSSTTSSRP